MLGKIALIHHGQGRAAGNMDLKADQSEPFSRPSGVPPPAHAYVMELPVSSECQILLQSGLLSLNFVIVSLPIAREQAEQLKSGMPGTISA